jgi:transposase
MSWPGVPAAAHAAAGRRSSTPPGTKTATRSNGPSTGLKQFRAVATRYDKLRDRYHATVTIASIMIWLRAQPDRAHP